jgi:hypothetical protein
MSGACLAIDIVRIEREWQVEALTKMNMIFHDLLYIRPRI